MKVTVIGAGNVGATTANVLATKDFLKEVVLVDIKKGVAEGKALDIWESGPILGFSTKVYGVTDDYEATAGSDVVVITSGVPRRPGMSRDDLIETNAKIVKEVAQKAIKYSPDAILVVVSNPLDVMTYVAWKATGLPTNRVMGMAGALDTARYRTFIADAAGVSPKDVQAMLMGGHGDSMVPLPRYTTINGIPVTEFIDNETLDKIVERTRFGGGEIVNLLGVSAWYAPGASAALMVETILKDEKRIIPTSAYLNGEYGFSGFFMGVPVLLGRNGVEKIIELDLTPEEMELVKKSAEHVKSLVDVVHKMGVV
ncbi:MAG: malate dehydrogenase [Chlorobi bacterium]|nr:malate dehydrogenase [Chlorobiota bacterium]